MGQKKYYLSQSSKNEKRKHAKGLHVAIWEFNNKREVPEGYHIHHKDFNPLNNNIDNLECIPYKQHLSLHAKKNLEIYKCKCKECGSYFESKVQTSQFCSDKCGERWRGKNRLNHINRKQKSKSL
ncbi:HNH endonuclease signature motif containing protein [Clostridioides difficile]